MQFTLDNGDAAFQIKAYEKGVIIVNEQTYNYPILVMPAHLIAPWGPDSFEELAPTHFEMILPYKPKLVILGTGKQHRFLPASLYAALINNNIGVEIMDTKAACRTYTVLMAEGREVIAGLFC
ncbi:MAG TPA: Mth938-like domain-containing protein [Gammaproteobacteria bacterium]|nr:Mth938-like domain-containing protein [Gammaproteobacteria bacterium]HQZ88327.1 Mth938-like domain-containing protein [Gammaproteobacteria bacterium]HRA42981.1 Mth938-like domain-containing protein [Gammaproteobacteria bacterium]